MLFLKSTITKRKLNQYLLDVKLTSKIVVMAALESLRKLLICTGSGSILLLNAEQAHEISSRNNPIENDNLFENELEYVLIDVPIKINTSLILQSRYEKK